MKLVLIPGLDGTGEFFKPFLDVYGTENAQVIPLPQEGPQDYAALTEYVAQRLPAGGNYVVLAESFGAFIGARLALRGLPRLKGIVFVAGFLSPPSWWAITLGLMLPWQATAPTLPGRMILRALLAGPQASAETLQRVQAVIGGVPDPVIKARLRAIRAMDRLRGRTDVPALYIRASRDRLIAPGKCAEFSAHFTDIKLFRIDGPHLVLPARPRDCAAAIRSLFPSLRDA